jgi:integrase
MVNLRMKASREAERLALSHWIAHEALIEGKRRELAEAAHRPRPVALSEYSHEAIQRFARELAQGLNRTQHAAIRAMRPRTELLELQDLLGQLAGDVLSASGVEGLARITEVFLHGADIPYDRDDASFRELVFEFATALDGEFVKPGLRRLHGREAVPPPPLPEDRPKAAERLSLGGVIERHMKTVKQSHYTRKVERCLQLFGEVVGGQRPIESLRQRDVTDFLRAICRLPSDWAQRFDRGAATVAEMLTEEHTEVMSPTTYKDNYKAPLKAFLRDARRDYGDEGFPALIVDGIDYIGNREAGEDEQRALTVAELQKLFEGSGFAAVAADPEREALYWLPVACLFTGARPRELCQVNPQHDFGEEGGIAFLDFDTATPSGKGVVKSIKTGEARRVPLHPELVRLGFPEYLKRVKEAGADRLFPSMRVKKGNPFEVAGGVFTEFLKGAGLYDNAAPPGRQVLGAYVLRKSFITQASNQGVMSRELTGHSAAGETRIQVRHYITEAEPLRRKDAELRKLVLPIKIPLRGFTSPL